jgi:hypothetical protein
LPATRIVFRSINEEVEAKLIDSIAIAVAMTDESAFLWRAMRLQKGMKVATRISDRGGKKHRTDYESLRCCKDAEVVKWAWCVGERINAKAEGLMTAIAREEGKSFLLFKIPCHLPVYSVPKHSQNPDFASNQRKEDPHPYR